MEQIVDERSSREIIRQKLRKTFDGRIVRKDLTKHIKEGANVPVYVLEFLLGQYCSSDEPEVIEKGVATVKKILADNYVRPDEAQKILSILRQRGSYTVIDYLFRICPQHIRLPVLVSGLCILTSSSLKERTERSCLIWWILMALSSRIRLKS